MKTVYLDNMIVCAITERDLRADKQESLDELVVIEKRRDTIRFQVSYEAQREVERTRDEEKKKRLKAGISQIDNVQENSRLLGFNAQDLGRYGFISSPLMSDVLDPTIFAQLTAFGFKKSDSIHFVNAVSNKCAVFLTTDTRFMTYRSDLESHYRQIIIRKPSELLSDLLGGVVLGVEDER
jgi:hypothetical protein